MEKIINVDGKSVKIEGEIETTSLHLHRIISDPPEIRIKISKMSKGYQWEVSTGGTDPDKVIAVLKDTETKLQAEYGAKE